MKPGENPYRATPPPWQGWPSAETSRRRWRTALLVPLVGAAGCGLLFLLGMGAFALLLIVSRLSVPVPDGEPLAMGTTEITGTWVDGEGGRVTLKENGTFTSDKICGDFDDNDDDHFDDVVTPAPGAGTWEHRTGAAIETDGQVSTVHITFTPDGIRAQYEARGTSEDPVLWTYIGDPDEGVLCVLERAAGRTNK
ncbi:hypothetical protein [Streptomyces europaeiscabiei]|uniref:hypothetical protein n=1 Tax=Streptomyces europaeiscabiei TaxID=146819 RepID=UPI002E13F8B5|nr:hypothetical protein OHB30_09980 [Streptomyces europaeiscabiei]